MSSHSHIQSAVIHVDGSTFHEEVLQSDVPVLVDFYADWCGPCKMLAPILSELVQETPDAKIVKVNVDDASDLAGRYGISSIPTLMVFKNGEVTAQQMGLASKSQLKALLR